MLEGLPFPSPQDLPDPGIELRSSALQRDSLLSELHGSPRNVRSVFGKQILHNDTEHTY